MRHATVFPKCAVILAVIWSVVFMMGCGPAASTNHEKEDQKINLPPDTSDYPDLWRQVEEFNDKGQPKSALEVVEKIYSAAKKNKDAGDFIKALIHKMRYFEEVEEDEPVKIQGELNRELKESEFPITPVLHSIMAEQYWNYYRSHRWEVMNAGAAGFNPEDIRTWDTVKFIKEVATHYKQSLENAENSKQTDIAVYDEIIEKGFNSRRFRPTLYDFLAHRAIDFYMKVEAGLPHPQYRFAPDSQDYFLEAEAFAQLELGPKEKNDPSFDFHALSYIQDLTRFHLGDRDPSALVDVDLKRLGYVHRWAVMGNKDLLYEKALRALLEKYKESRVAAAIYYKLGEFYNRLGDKYEPGIPGTGEDYKEYKKKAHELCREAIKKYPGTIGAVDCRALIDQIEARQLQLTLEQVAVRRAPSRGLLNYRNIDKVYLKIVKTSHAEVQEKQELSTEERVAYFLGQETVKSWEVALPKEKDYRDHAAEIKIDGLEWGLYAILAANTPDFDYKNNVVAYGLFTISNIAYFHRSPNEERLDFYLVDRDTGRPLPNARARAWFPGYSNTRKRFIQRESRTFTTDKNGYFSISGGPRWKNYFSLEFIAGNGEDHLYTDTDFDLFQWDSRKREQIRTIFFTDRAIYRPGQVVYFKGIMLNIDPGGSESTQLLKNHPSRVTLYDVNNQELGDLDLKTNEFGTFSGTFALPVGRLNGSMKIADDYGKVYILMEEYKRPKFQVTFQPIEKNLRLNHRVTITGKASALAGYPIDHGKVKYRVVRKAFDPYSWDTRYGYDGYFPHAGESEITNGTTTTDADGAFKVTFTAVPDLALPREIQLAFCFTVFADVTDINGETQGAQKKVDIGYMSLILGMDLPGTLDKDRKEVTVALNSTNLSGEFVNAAGEIAIYKLKEPDRLFRARLWPKPDRYTMEKSSYYKDFPYDPYDDETNMTQWEREKRVFYTRFETGELKKCRLYGLEQWQTGPYAAEMKSTDSIGNEIKKVKYFTLFSGTGKQVPYPLLGWFSLPKVRVYPGETAVILIGTAAKDVRVVYQVEHRGKIVDTQYLILDNEQKRIGIPILEKYRGNIGVHIAFVKHNRLITYSRVIEVPWSDKKLDISIETFRDHLIPGEKEQWRIRIKGAQGEPALAEMVATLYDASLDTFRVNDWDPGSRGEGIFPYHPLCYGWTTNPGFSTISTDFIGKLQEEATVGKTYDRLNWFGINWVPNVVYCRGVAAKSGSRPGKIEIADQINPEDLGIAEDIKISHQESRQAQLEKEGGPVQVRKNFNETAFFYPHLRTTPEGEIVIVFTVPEALTQWKMMGFAHTQNLEYGYVTKKLVTRKDLMVEPNTPRFFREGDTILYTVKITNLAGKELAGTAHLQLFDAATMKPVDELFKNLKPAISFKAGKGHSTQVSWKLQIPEELDAVTYRLTAKAGTFSDGEEQAVPILKNRMLVTESMPLPVRAKQTKSFRFDKLVGSAASKTLKHRRLILEFTSNPVWNAVQALPFLMEYPYECTEQIFSRYYANSMASYIVNTNPKIKRVFDLWKTAAPGSANANALLSNLEKNRELKTLLMEETPWVVEGQDERQWKQRVALLFDLNTMVVELNGDLGKLDESQMELGAWPWFKGMREDRYITQHIVCGFAHLDRLKIINTRKNRRMWAMLYKAVLYMDRQIAKDYQYIIDNDIDLKKKNLGYLQVHYLYARSYYRDIPMGIGDKKAFEYYKGQVKQYWVDFSKDKYMQGMMALILERYKDTEIAMVIGRSIKEHALYSEEMGMYWKGSNGYYWYQAPIETHALLVEMFSEVMKDAKSVEKMKTWLLKQKQTQNWKTTKATVEACYALLLRGEEWLKEIRAPEIRLGKEHPIVIVPGKTGGDGEQIKAEAGTGYFKTSWTGKDIVPDMGLVTVKNNNNIVAWGSLYWQYFENLDKITPAETPLGLKKKLFFEKASDTGPVIHPIEAKTPLKVGDKVKVRIELRVDRDMEYVQMKDMRASCMEPEDVISGYRWQGGLGYYQSTKDGSTHFFFDYLPKGTYVFEYGLKVTHEGDFSNGITSIQCMYAPEFTSHSEGVRVEVKQ